MEISEKYAVYSLNKIMGNKDNLSLQEEEFNSMVSNSFDTEKEAIEALIKDEKTYTDYLILKQIYITT